MTTFCPGGRVLDPFEGKMTAGTACIETNRPCVLIEPDEECFELSHARIVLQSKEKVSLRTDRVTKQSRGGTVKSTPTTSETDNFLSHSLREPDSGDDFQSTEKSSTEAGD